MTEYMPKTGQVLNAYVAYKSANYLDFDPMEFRREFERWLEQVKAEAWDDGAEAAGMPLSERNVQNPSRT